MPYIFEYDSEITPTMLEVPYQSPASEQIICYVSSGDTWLEAKGAIEQSISRQTPMLASILTVVAAMSIVSVVEADAGELALSGKSEVIYNEEYFRGATQAALIVATVGRGAEEQCAKLLKRGEYIDALVVDAMASAILNNAIVEIKKKLIQQGKGIQVGYSLFPGSRGIPLNFQRIIFELIKPEHTIGVKLTESMLLVPVKSTSTIIPIGYELGRPGLREDDSMLYVMGKRTSYGLI